jgi:predicted small lipoprotein YifL
MLAVGTAVALTLSLAACGRKGGLDMPPSDTPAPTSNLTASEAPASPTMAPQGPQGLFGGSASNAGPAPNAVDAQGHAIYQPPGPKKPFILDPILQ